MLNILVNCGLSLTKDLLKNLVNLQGEHGLGQAKKAYKCFFFQSSTAKPTLQVEPEFGPNFWIQPGRAIRLKKWVGLCWVQIRVQSKYVINKPN